MYVYLYTHTEVHTSLCVGICVCVCICVFGDFHVCMYVYIMCVYICRIYPEKHTYVNKNKKISLVKGGPHPNKLQIRTSQDMFLILVAVARYYDMYGGLCGKRAGGEELGRFYMCLFINVRFFNKGFESARLGICR